MLQQRTVRIRGYWLTFLYINDAMSPVSIRLGYASVIQEQHGKFHVESS
jgi:hypothetical protein